jgi:hypothetical protein
MVDPPAIKIDTSVALTTDNVALPLTVPEAAVIVVVPCVNAVASPPTATVATAVFEDDQVAVAVRFWVELSL